MSRPPPPAGAASPAAAAAVPPAAAAAAATAAPESESLASSTSPTLRNIAISVNKPSRAFFNIARKAMLEGADAVQLSALESAIAIAIDATFLLTRAKMAEVEKIETAFVEVPYYHHGPERQQQQQHMARKARMIIRLRKTEAFREYARARQEHLIEEEEFEEDY